MSRKRKSWLSRIVAVLLFLALCTLVLGMIWVANALPQLAQREFGPANPALTPLQRLTISAQLFLYRSDLIQPLDPAGTERPFSIALGESINSIAFRLEREGIIREAMSFRLYLIYSGADTLIQAGEFKLSPALNALEVALALQDATPQEVKFRILAGWRLEEVASALPTSGLQITAEEFIQLARNPGGFHLPEGITEVATLEGLLMPAEYILDRETSAAQMIQIMLERFAESITPELRTAVERQGLDLNEALILASIVEREAVVAGEQALIASVFHNRLQTGMKLDADPTVQYAVGYNPDHQTWWTNPLSRSDLAFDSPYNTYIYNGLPPTPICNPSPGALEAVAFPAQTPYYYFRAACDGSGRHVFATTYEEHQQNACP